jgi:3-phenylpropionate/trans-cinnamate dioxygenase ferredoxin reductase subunit
VRTRADADRMMADSPDVEHVVVIGGGYIGLEAAAVLTKFGKRVVLLEALDRVLARVAGEPLSRFYEAEHRAHGVDRKAGRGGRMPGGRRTGHRRPVGRWRSDRSGQMVIVGIGINLRSVRCSPRGAKGGNGVAVDGFCRTTLPDVFAIGDCAAARQPLCRGGADPAGIGAERQRPGGPV